MSDLHYIEKGAGVPVVLLHGFPVDGRIWRGQLKELSKTNRVIVIDLPGFGKTPLDGAYTMDSLAVQVHGLLKEIGAEPCVLGGLSMGGYVALAFYQKFPTDIKGLILVDTRATGDTPEATANRNELIRQVHHRGPCAVVDAMMPKVVSDNTIAAEPETVTIVREMMEACTPAALEHALVALRDRVDRTELLPSIAEPVLIIVGECDTITPPAEARQMQQAIPRATLQIVPDAAHFSPIENPAFVNRAISDFLRQLNSR